MKAMDVMERLTPELMAKIDEIAGNKPEPPFDWREM